MQPSASGEASALAPPSPDALADTGEGRGTDEERACGLPREGTHAASPIEEAIHPFAAAHRYVAATPAADLAAELALRDTRIGRKAIGRLSVDELREAARRVIAASLRARRPSPPVRARAREVQRALRTRDAKSGCVRAKPDGAGIVLEIRLARRTRGAKSGCVRAKRDGAGIVLEIRLALDDADAVLP